jgi:RNA-binding protein
MNKKSPVGKQSAPQQSLSGAPGAGSASPRATRAATRESGAAPAPLAPDLTEKQRKHLRGLAHALKPVILLGGSGLTEGVTKETARALHDHELIKVKAPGGDREARDALFSDLAQRTGSALVHRIGNVAVLYRPRPEMTRILIPDG